MSKHPTSELSPRDIAAMDYGCYHFDVLSSFKHRRTWGNSYLRAKIKDAREARARIFRSCYNCNLLCRIGKDFACSIDEDYMRWHHENACTCPHYEERGEA